MQKNLIKLIIYLLLKKFILYDRYNYSKILTLIHKKKYICSFVLKIEALCNIEKRNNNRSTLSDSETIICCQKYKESLYRLWKITGTFIIIRSKLCRCAYSSGVCVSCALAYVCFMILIK